MIRDDIKAALIKSMKAREEARTSAIRLIQAAVKNRDIELRGSDAPADDDQLLIDVLQKMAKQRRESIEMYISGGRNELADAERAELAVIEEFLPKQMDEDEARALVAAAIAEAGAASPKDMGRVMPLLKEKLAGRFDMARASALVKEALAS